MRPKRAAHVDEDHESQCAGRSCHHRGAVLRSLGTADADALDIEVKALFSTDELKRKAEIARLRRVEAGIQDEIENMQPLAPPAFDQALVGKKIEVCACTYIVTRTGEREGWRAGVGREGRGGRKGSR